MTVRRRKIAFLYDRKDYKEEKKTLYTSFWTTLVMTFTETWRHPELGLSKAKVNLKSTHDFDHLAPFPVEAGST